MRRFTLEYWKDEGWYVGRLKQLPSIFSQGKTLNELEGNIRDAYQLMRQDEKDSLPDAKVKTKELRIAA